MKQCLDLRFFIKICFIKNKISFAKIFKNKWNGLNILKNMIEIILFSFINKWKKQLVEVTQMFINAFFLIKLKLDKSDNTLYAMKVIDV